MFWLIELIEVLMGSWTKERAQRWTAKGARIDHSSQRDASHAPGTPVRKGQPLSAPLRPTLKITEPKSRLDATIEHAQEKTR